jgi:hypothetical protein
MLADGTCVRTSRLISREPRAKGPGLQQFWRTVGIG